MPLESPPFCLPLALLTAALAGASLIGWAALAHEPVPAAVARLDDGSQGLFAQVRALRRRVGAFDRRGARPTQRRPDVQGPDFRGAGSLVFARLEELELRAAESVTDRAMGSGRPADVRGAVRLWGELLARGDMPLERRRRAYGSLASLADPGVFASDELGAAWVRDAHLLTDRGERRSHLMNARHLAPGDAAVRDHLLGTALFDADEELRGAAMRGLVHCGYSQAVADAMELIAATAPAAHLRAEARGWLRLAPERQGDAR